MQDFERLSRVPAEGLFQVETAEDKPRVAAELAAQRAGVCLAVGHPDTCFFSPDRIGAACGEDQSKRQHTRPKQAWSAALGFWNDGVLKFREPDGATNSGLLHGTNKALGVGQRKPYRAPLRRERSSLRRVWSFWKAPCITLTFITEWVSRTPRAMGVSFVPSASRSTPSCFNIAA